MLGMSRHESVEWKERTLKKTWVVLALAGAAALSACRDDAGDQRTDTVTPATMEAARANWPAGLADAIDSANAAYSAGDYEEASNQYRRATEIAPDVTAGWFGVYMAEHARGNIATADSAMQRARALSPEANLIHGTPDDTMRPHP
jgi:tetratricopeptide (TPR) repeat protein